MSSIQNLLHRRDKAADHIKDQPATPQFVYDLLVDNPVMLSWLLLLTALCLILYLTRNRILSAMNRYAERLLPGHLYQRLPNNFQGDVEAGLTSSHFDLTGNIMDGDSRAGLDDESKAEIMRIMKRERCTFDEARRKHVVDKLAKNGIGPDGRPLDPRAVFFS